MDVTGFEGLVNRLGKTCRVGPTRSVMLVPFSSRRRPRPELLTEQARALRAALAADAVRAPSGLVGRIDVVARKLKIGSLDAKEDAAVPAVDVTGRGRCRCEQ
jgi:hypothetical protein